MGNDIRLALAGDIRDVPTALLHAIAAESIRFEAICDSDAARAETAARTYGARWPFDDLDQMLREAEPDAVIVAAPLARRSRWSKTCLRSRAAVLILGAPASTVGECRTLLTASRQVNRQVMVGLPQRFSPAFLRGRRILESGRMGPLASLDISMTWPRQATAEEGPEHSVPFDLMFEAADRLRSCGVKPFKVWAVERPYGHLVAMVVGTDGVVGSVALHHTGTPQSAGSRMELRSEDGGLLLVEDDVNLECTVGSQLVGRHHPRFGAGDDPRVERGFTGMIAAFATALRARQGVPYGLPSAMASVALAEATFKAARTGRAVNFKTE